MEQTQVYGFEMIHIEEITEIMHRERTLLIDLRSEESFREGHMKYARNFPFSHIARWRREIPNGLSLILYCEHGNLSLMAARKLKERTGAVYTVIGGYEAYRNSIQREESGAAVSSADAKP